MKYFFTSESVTEGHPDKICDSISDAILDVALESDKNSHMAVEATIKGNTIFIYGEALTNAKINYAKIARKVIKDIGYKKHFHVIKKVTKQSNEINKAVQNVGAGDQGIMFGFACQDTKEYMPLPIMIANNITKKMDEVRHSDKNSPLCPDGKCEVTVEYEGSIPKKVDTVIVSSSHIKNISQEDLKIYIIENIIKKVVKLDKNTKIIINPSGSFIKFGPDADSGTTGRKIIVDTYGGMGRVGGGCFSSKDPSKVDRSGAYYARYVAKNIVHYNLCTKCEVQVSYAIGRNEAISYFIDTFGTEKRKIEDIYAFVQQNFDFSFNNIINELDLKNVKYFQYSRYGHFGRKAPWENIKLDIFK